jgi:hypothetical protein
VSERDDEGRLRDAFARLRSAEAQRAPTLAQLRARTGQRVVARGPRLAWLRIALPLAAASTAALALWIGSGTPDGSAEPPLAAVPPQQLEQGARPKTPGPIALGSLRSPTDALLAPPLGALPSGFSHSLIPAPPVRARENDPQSHVWKIGRTPA